MEQEANLIFEIEPEDPAQLSQPLTLHDNVASEGERELKVRLDKWLWAARFFKTRALARSAVECSQVLYDGQKVAPSKEIDVGATLLINKGKTKKAIIIQRLSTRRRGSDETSSLFKEISPNIYASDLFVTERYDPQITLQPEKKVRKVARFLRRSLAFGGEPQKE